ncbi:uncharacterized protein LOC131011176 [Salvia miltiorrhiza]|uniref:uncharacterized protein LOC131011176 n=1 Tax=Salvia miltiorrhiza TaxID=226208 RepID=UPI0025AD0383|nr:uncharacterized protein LOC131011176 [Salvia miltiorrhiza]
MEQFDDTSSFSSDGIIEKIIDELQEQQQLLAAMYSQPAPERVIHHRQYVHRDREGEDTYFQMSHDARDQDFLTPLQKCTAAICELATGVSADTFDEYLKVVETTGRLCLKKFCTAVIQAFGAHYLRRPTSADIQRLTQMHEARHGFPRMLGNVDCIHWAWKNCPKAWHDAYTRGDQEEPTLILEVVASHDLWI